MKLNEINFETLDENFETICDEINDSKEAVTLSLKSGRKVYILPEENYNNVSHFVMAKISPLSTKSHN